MSQVRTTKKIDPSALKETLGVDIFTSAPNGRDDPTRDIEARSLNEETGEWEWLPEEELQAAIDAYEPPVDRRKQLAEKPGNLTAQEIQEAIRLLLGLETRR